MDDGMPSAKIKSREDLTIDLANSSLFFSALFDKEAPELSGHAEYALLGLVVEDKVGSKYEPRIIASASKIQGLMLAKRSEDEDIWIRIGCFEITCYED
jgi:hypothetical protein